MYCPTFYLIYYYISMHTVKKLHVKLHVIILQLHINYTTIIIDNFTTRY